MNKLDECDIESIINYLGFVWEDVYEYYEEFLNAIEEYLQVQKDKIK